MHGQLVGFFHGHFVTEKTPRWHPGNKRRSMFLVVVSRKQLRPKLTEWEKNAFSISHRSPKLLMNRMISV